MAVDPEKIGLSGCWQIVAVCREEIPIIERCNAGELSEEVRYYVTSTAYKPGQAEDEELLGAIRGHWDAIENGSHYRRDVCFGEDQCRIKHRGAAQIMAALRNLAIGLYELEKNRKKIPKGRGFKATCKRMTFSKALDLLKS